MTTERRLAPSDRALRDEYGTAVAVSGDTAVIGSPYDDDTGADSGSAYVFVRSGGGWTQQAKLTASDGAAYSHLGMAVAIDGDTIAVAARQADAPALDSGAAYVFVRTGTTWTQQAKLTASDGATNEWYGSAVAVSGDTAIVGCQSHTHGGTRRGAAYVYVRTAGTWTEQAELVGYGADDDFGAGVAIDRDTAVIGAPGRSSDAGTAYVFVRTGSTWTQQANINGTGLTPADYYGRDVAVDGDTVVVGAAEFNPGGVIVAGAGFVFVRSGTTWTQQARLLASGPAEWDRLGASVALSRDVAVLGATGADGATVDSGAALVFVRGGTTWSLEARLGGMGGLGSDLFGTAVGIDDRIAIVGAPGNDEIADRAGAAHAFHLLSERGDPCSDDADCTTGACSDAVCCDRACGALGDCQACSVVAGAAVDGTCTTLAAGRLCRPLDGVCDLAESCDGASTACPSDSFVPAGLTCRARAGACDAAEACTGASASCPADRAAPDGTACDDGSVCTDSDACASGSCTAGAALDCEEGNLCTADACSEPGGCTHVPIADCCNADRDCDDADVCTADRCPTPGGACTFAPITGCCVADGGCDDGSDCTADRCDAATDRCTFAPIPGCCSGDADCADADACTADVCTVATGACTRTRVAGCCSTGGDCDDLDRCTADSCPAAGGSCRFEPIDGCCESDGECDDGDDCTIDACSTITFRCESTPDPVCMGPDAGLDAGTDASRPDGGTDASPVDAATDDASAPDAGGADGAIDAGEASPDDGCGCGVPGARPSGGVFALLVVVSLAVRMARRGNRPARR